MLQRGLNTFANDEHVIYAFCDPRKRSAKLNSGGLDAAYGAEVWHSATATAC